MIIVIMLLAFGGMWWVAFAARDAHKARQQAEQKARETEVLRG